MRARPAHRWRQRGRTRASAFTLAACLRSVQRAHADAGSRARFSQKLRTALLFAAANGHSGCVEMLLHGDAEKEHKDVRHARTCRWAFVRPSDVFLHDVCRHLATRRSTSQCSTATSNACGCCWSMAPTDRTQTRCAESCRYAHASTCPLRRCSAASDARSRRVQAGKTALDMAKNAEISAALHNITGACAVVRVPHMCEPAR
jgi:hypothetical protein